jgi:hypothetical protein
MNTNMAIKVTLTLIITAVILSLGASYAFHVAFGMTDASDRNLAPLIEVMIHAIIWIAICSPVAIISFNCFTTRVNKA